ncbi:MAG: helix-turn-helix domain-containing protein [Verrucomicrobiota bacterium]
MNKRDVDNFYSEVDWKSVVRSLSSLLTEDAFFMKDLEGRFVMNNRRAIEFCNVATEEETLGKKDEDFWSMDRARIYVEGDRMVMESGLPIINQLAPAPEEIGSGNMVIYSKFPVKNKKGEIIGIAGIHRLIGEEGFQSTQLKRLYKAVQMIHRDFASDLLTSDLAKLSGLSISQFNRRFKQILSLSPREYLLRVRVRNACRLLETTRETVSSIAMFCGFYDHSHFSHAFRKHTGLSPTRYRREHGQEI